jgi:hypothetical protein
MNEAKELIIVAAPLLQYVFPTIFLLSVVSFADLMIDFAVKIISSISKRMRFN